MRRESAERATRDSRRLSSTPRARTRDAKARSGQLSIRGGCLQPLARIRETRKRGAGNVRIAALSFSPSRASVRRESAEWATLDSRRLSSAPRAHPRDAPAWSRQLAIRGGFLQHLARVRETRKRGAGNARFAAAFFCPSRASARRESAERAKRESRRFSSAPRARPRDAKARSGQRAIRDGFLQSLARLHETRQRGVGNARFTAAFFSTSRASVRRESAERAARDSRRILQHFVRICETRKRGAGNARFAAAFFSPSRASASRTSAERETRESRRFSSAPRARPRDAPARSGQRAIRGSFLQPLARIRETRKRGAGNVRIAAAFFYLSRASARRESAERATRDSRRLSSTPRARPRDAKARSGKRAIRSGFFQSLARIRETRKRGAGNARFAAAFFSPSRGSTKRESAERATCESRCFLSAPRAHPRGAPARSRQRVIRGAFFNLSRASARRESAEWATLDSRRLSSAPRARPRDAPARSGQRVNRGAFLQPLARVCETRKRGTGSA